MLNYVNSIQSHVDSVKQRKFTHQKLKIFIKFFLYYKLYTECSIIPSLHSGQQNGKKRQSHRFCNKIVCNFKNNFGKHVSYKECKTLKTKSE